jgi:uncharacterized protein (TIGR02466 family)|tara:strand:+ start:503 stop:1132 length:630 start_codon:yes stop_codon:yes gene_type:complete
MSGVPIFPSGIIKQYISPISFGDNTDLTKFTYEQFKGSTKLRTEKFKNILLDPSLKDLKTWIEIQAKDYLDNELGIDYDEFFFSESWININGKGGDQKVHNHSNSIVSGTYYLKSLDGHPPLDFHKVKSENEPFISLTEHYAQGNPNTTSKVSFPSTQDSMLVFQSQLYHGHMASELEENRIGLSWNILVNFKQKDKSIYRIRFVNEGT